MPAGTINQITEAAIPGDAITDQILLIRKWLRESGYRSEIYATHCLPEMESEVRPMTSYRRRGGEETLIYHHAIGSTAAEWLIQLEIPLILIYHNITPSGFFSRTDPALSAQLIEGRRQIKTLQKQTILALADSDYNEVELKQAGYENTGVLPIVIDPVMYDLTPDQAVLKQYRDGPPNLLFLGRLAPNKRQEDLIKLLYYYHRIEPEARLILVGSGFLGGYARWLKEFASTLNLSECVDFPGHVSQTEMIAYFKVADLYVSMSEHEGFGKPLIESMYFELPVLAYNSTAVPYTLGEAGVLFNQKQYEVLAEFVNILVRDEHLRYSIIEKQKRRVFGFLEPQVRECWQQYLAELNQS